MPTSTFRCGPLERIVVTPFFHHWHHSAAQGTWNTNYAGSLPAVDWLFGTLSLPDRWPEEYGCDGDVPDTGYVARCLSPWRRPSMPRHLPSKAACSLRALAANPAYTSSEVHSTDE